jgi:hypothetical protein
MLTVRVRNRHFVGKIQHFLCHVIPASLLDDVADKNYYGALVDESGVFPCRDYSTVAIHIHFTWGMNNKPVGGHS